VAAGLSGLLSNIQQQPDGLPVPDSNPWDTPGDTVARATPDAGQVPASYTSPATMTKDEVDKFNWNRMATDLIIKEENPHEIMDAHFPGTRRPTPKSGTAASGVTVAAGMDLGQHTKKELLSWGMDPELVDRFDKAGYIGKKGAAAWDVLQRNPMTLSQEEVDHVNNVALDASRAKAERLVNTYAGPGVWESLTPKQQIGLTSSAHNGTLMGTTAGLLKNGRWDQFARTHLQQFPNQRSRILREHEYMGL
jgi:hypothetical protein